MGKKILILLVLLILLIIYTVTKFDYKTILNENSSDNDSSAMQKEKIVDTIFSKVDELKKTVTETLIDEETNVVELNENLISLELIKKDDKLLMNGILRDENQASEIESLLNINNSGDYKFNPAIKVDDELLIKVSELIIPIKDFLSNGSKLEINGENVTLNGELKDASHSELLKSIINRIGIDLDISNLKVKEKTKTEEIINSLKEKNINNLKDISTDKDIKKIVTKEQNKSVNKLEEVQSSINNVLSTNKITFERRSTKITDDSFSSVKDIANLLKENSDIKIEIGGHTDSRGAASLNKRISQDRANSVMNALINLGIEKSRLTAVGYGEDFPIAKDDKNGLSEVNRRVEIKVLGE